MIEFYNFKTESQNPSMIQVIKCPSCAAPLEIDNNDFERCEFCGSRITISPLNTVSPNSLDFDGLLTQAHKLKEVLYLAHAGRKIEAIKIYRETFGNGLAEAKEAVENLIIGKPINFTNFKMFSVNSLLQNSAEPFEQTGNLSEIQAELWRGNKINAIKIYREQFGVSLKEAKDAVEALERNESVAFHIKNPLNKKVKASNLSTVNRSKTNRAIAIGWVTVIFILLGAIAALTGLGVAVFSTINAIYPTSDKSTSSNSQTQPVSSKPAFATEMLRSGGDGIGGGFFKDNRLVAIDGDDRVYSVNYNGGQLQQFDTSGKFLAQWNIGENINLRDLIADRKNRLYVLNSNNLTVYGVSDKQAFSKIERHNYKCLALDANGKLFAVNQNNELVKLDESGKPFDNPVSLSKQLNFESKNLTGLTIDAAGNFYVFDADKKYILKFSPDAKFLVRFDNPSNKNKKLNAINDLATDGKGRIFVSETNEIHVYDNDGRYLDSFETRQSFGMAFDSKNALWTASRPFVIKYALNQ